MGGLEKLATKNYANSIVIIEVFAIMEHANVRLMNSQENFVSSNCVLMNATIMEGVR